MDQESPEGSSDLTFEDSLGEEDSRDRSTLRLTPWKSDESEMRLAQIDELFSDEGESEPESGGLKLDGDAQDSSGMDQEGTDLGDINSLFDDELSDSDDSETSGLDALGKSDDAGDKDVKKLTPQEQCQKALDSLSRTQIDQIELNIGVSGTVGDDYPYECALAREGFAPRCWPETMYTWKASSLCHKPLYFEEEALERYGHSKGPYVQTLYSGAHFFATLPILPYKIGLRTPQECVYALGHYRPGSCAPYLHYPLPLSKRAALFQAGAVVGAAAILP